jgi:hypothetical protein
VAHPQPFAGCRFAGRIRRYDRRGDRARTLRAVAVDHQRDVVAVVCVERTEQGVLVVAPEATGREREREYVLTAGTATDYRLAVAHPELEGAIASPVSRPITRLVARHRAERTRVVERDRRPVHAFGVGVGREPADHLEPGVIERIGVRLVTPTGLPAEELADERAEVVGEVRGGRLPTGLVQLRERPLSHEDVSVVGLDQRPEDGDPRGAAEEFERLAGGVGARDGSGVAGSDVTVRVVVHPTR